MPCLPASSLTPCLLALVCICPSPSITMCARIIAQVAGTALQAAPLTIVFACVGDQPLFCKDCPAGSYTTGTALSSPCTVFASSIQFTSGRSLGLHWAAGYLPVLVFTASCVQFKGEAWDCIGQPATFLSLHREPDCIWAAWLPSSNGLWDGIWHAGLR